MPASVGLLGRRRRDRVWLRRHGESSIEAAKDNSVSKVIILEKGSYRERGGNSRVCGQGIWSAGARDLGRLQGVPHA